VSARRRRRCRRPAAPVAITRTITLAEGMTVKDLADKLDVRVKDVLAKLLMRRMMMNINSTVDMETAKDLAREFGADIEMRSFEEELVSAEGDESKPEDMTVRAPGRHRHGSRGPRQDVAARRHPRNQGGRARGRRHHAAHRRLPRGRGRPQRGVPRHARSRRRSR
jgi:translation initiation factor IF-2